MQGAIPLAFTCLTPLIISKVSNQYYKFKNVIEYMDEDIILKKVNLKDLFEGKASSEISRQIKKLVDKK